MATVRREAGGLGIGLNKENGVSTLKPGSVADRAGIQVGDRIVEVRPPPLLLHQQHQ